MRECYPRQNIHIMELQIFTSLLLCVYLSDSSPETVYSLQRRHFESLQNLISSYQPQPLQPDSLTLLQNRESHNSVAHMGLQGQEIDHSQENSEESGALKRHDMHHSNHFLCYSRFEVLLV